MATKGKRWYQSRTVWFGALIILNAVAGVFGFATYEPGLEVQRAVELISGVGVIALRLITKEPIRS